MSQNVEKMQLWPRVIHLSRKLDMNSGGMERLQQSHYSQHC